MSGNFSRILKNQPSFAGILMCLVTFLFVGVFFSHSTASVLAKSVNVERVEIPGFADIVQKVSPAVVSVRVKAKVKFSKQVNGFDFFGEDFDDIFPDGHPLKRFFREFHSKKPRDKTEKNKSDKDYYSREKVRPISQGSGFFISEDGYIVTNNHVVKGGQEFTIVLDKGKEYSAKLVGTDSRTDLALLKIDGSSEKFTYVDFADDSKIRVGDWVVAVGNAFGLGGTVTAGIISARGRDIGAGPYDDFIQIDAAVNYGNSGGPAFNLMGQVIGVNTAIFSPSGGNVGIAFAIPGSTVKEVVAGLMKDGVISRGWLGVQIQSVTDEIAESLGMEKALGALVIEVSKNAPAKKSGINIGDVIIGVNGKEVSSPKELARLIGSITPGQVVDVSVWRKGKSENIKVNLGLLPSPEKSEAQKATPAENFLEELGMALVTSENDLGLVVTDVDPDGIAAERGIQIGDMLVAINNLPIKDIKDFIDQMKEILKEGRKSVLVQVNRGGIIRFIPLPIPSLK